MTVNRCVSVWEAFIRIKCHFRPIPINPRRVFLSGKTNLTCFAADLSESKTDGSFHTPLRASSVSCGESTRLCSCRKWSLQCGTWRGGETWLNAGLNDEVMVKQVVYHDKIFQKFEENVCSISADFYDHMKESYPEQVSEIKKCIFYTGQVHWFASPHVGVGYPYTLTPLSVQFGKTGGY